jgi:[ribosomal protein S5]-alanine N-acetyltransferase
MTDHADFQVDGQQVRLRRFCEADISATYLAWLNDPVTMRYSNQRFVQHTHETSLRYLHSFAGTPNYFLSVTSLQSGAALGTMTAYVSQVHGTADMGILMGNRAQWGKGYGLDAWRTLMAWLLQARSLRKVTAGTLDCNAAMLRLMEKSGMAFEGARKRQEIVDGAAHDLLYYAKFADG